VKVAIIAVSRDGLKIGKRLLNLYPQASIYAPPRLLGSAVELAAHPSGIAEDEGGLVSMTPGADKHSNSLTSERTTQEYSLPSLERTTQENPLPLEGGGSGWGCIINPLPGNFSRAIATIFNQYQLLIFISATAVAVRAIAPCLQGKDKDPAVVVIDDQARFAISLLSGHLGGANKAAEEIAHFLGACPVITTATDNRGVTAFDDLARKLGWHIENLPDLKKISAALLEDREIFILSDQPFNIPLSGRIRITRDAEDLKQAINGYVLINSRKDPLPHYPPYPHIVLRPSSIAAGVGCRKGISAAAIIRAVENAFSKAGLALASLVCLATGEFKAEEEGLIRAAAHFKVSLRIFTGKEIEQQIGAGTISEFVKNQVGVGAVAEPCARLGSGGGPLLLEVQRGEGITVALAESLFYTSREE